MKSPPPGRHGPAPASRRPASPSGPRPSEPRPSDQRQSKPGQFKPGQFKPGQLKPGQLKPGGREGFRDGHAPGRDQPRPGKPDHAPARQDAKPRLTLARPATPPAPAPRSPSRERTQHAARPAETPRGSVWLYGLHAVAAALANPRRRLRRLVLTAEAQATLAARLPPPWALTPELMERGRLDTLLGRDATHQGIALLADPLAPPALAQALERPGPILVLDQVSDPRNVGAILRCAAAFGVAAVITQDRNAPDETGALAKAASGALETVPLLRAVNIARTLIALKAAGCWTIGLDADGPALSGPALSERRVALVLGAEGDGMRRLTRETCDELAGIAMPGRGVALDSLNVSAAAAVALYELSRRS